MVAILVWRSVWQEVGAYHLANLTNFSSAQAIFSTGSTVRRLLWEHKHILIAHNIVLSYDLLIIKMGLSIMPPGITGGIFKIRLFLFKAGEEEQKMFMQRTEKLFKTVEYQGQWCS